MADGSSPSPARCDLAAERKLVGAVLQFPESIASAARFVSGQSFSDIALGRVFDAALDVAKRTPNFDAVLVCHALREAGSLNAIGGAQFVSELLDATSTSAWVDDHARIVAEHARARAIVTAAKRVALLETDNTVTANALAEVATREIVAAATPNEQRDDECDLHDAIVDVFEEIERAAESGTTVSGYATGLIDLDDCTNGLHADELIILAARPSFGKSALAMQIALHVAENARLGVLFVSLEMSRKDLARRSLAHRARVALQSIRAAKISQDGMAAMVRAAEVQHGLPIRIAYPAKATVLDVARRARAMKASARGLALIVVDYLQLMTAGRDRDSREREVAEISRGLKSLAMELHVPIMALSQLNRSPETGASGKGRRPRLSDLRESGAIEQDADVVLFIHREESEPTVSEIIVAKQRNGERRPVRVAWIGEHTRFENLAPDDARREPQEEHRPTRSRWGGGNSYGHRTGTSE